MAGESSVVYEVRQSQKTLFMTSTRPMKWSWVHMGPSRTWFSALNERCEFTSMRPSTCCSCSCVFCASDESICDWRRQYRVYAKSLTDAVFLHLRLMAGKEKELGDLVEIYKNKKTAAYHPFCLQRHWNSERIPKDKHQGKAGNTRVCIYSLCVFLHLKEFIKLLCRYIYHEDLCNWSKQGCVISAHLFYSQSSVCVGCCIGVCLQTQGLPRMHWFSNTVVPSRIQMSIFTIHTNRIPQWGPEVGLTFKKVILYGISFIREQVRWKEGEELRLWNQVENAGRLSSLS